MRFTIIAVALALATTIAGPPARAQSLGFPIPALVPLKTPSNSAVRPGGRYGLAVTPASVAREWSDQLVASLPDPTRLTQSGGVFAVDNGANPLGPKTFEA